jgi:hypothetical protein
MAQKRIVYILVVLICIGFVILGIIVRFYPLVPDEPILPPLDPLPPADETPGDVIAPITLENITFSALAEFFVLLPHHPPNHFHFDLEVNITNEGSSPLNDFDAVKASVFIQNNTLLYTFGLIPAENYTVAVGEERVLKYENDRNIPNLPASVQDKELYLRVLVMYNTSQEVIITTPVASILVAVE